MDEIVGYSVTAGLLKMSNVQVRTVVVNTETVV